MKAGFAYPYRPADGREDLRASDRVRRVLRGGAFGHYTGGVRCAVRHRFHPDYRLDFIGFRVAVSPFDRL